MRDGEPAKIANWIRFPFEFLLSLARPSLLDRLRARRGTDLDRQLAAWMAARGPQSGDWVQHDKQTGIRVLARIGGAGFTAVVNRWLDDGERHAKLDAAELAARRPDEGTAERLARLALADELWDGRHPLVQSRAAATLASFGRWRDVIAYFVRWGLKSFTNVDAYRDEASVLEDEAMGPAFAVLAEEGDIPPGALLALGFGGRADRSDRVRAAIESSPADSDLAVAGLQALRDFGVADPGLVPLMARSMGPQPFAATNALLANGTEPALQVLIDELRRRYDDGLALPLLHDPATSKQAAAIVRERLRAGGYECLRTLRTLVGHGLPRETLSECTASDDVQERLAELIFERDAGSPFVGDRAAAVCLAALRDPVLAFEAAAAALRDEEERDRERYPRLLADLDPVRAVAALVRQARTEASTKVLRAIGRAMPLPGGGEALVAELSAEEPDRRAAACRVAAWLPPGHGLTAAVRARLEDPSADVVSAARHAVESLDLSEAAAELADAFLREADGTHRWTLLDGLLAAGDPGGAGDPWPWWATLVAPSLTRAMAADLEEELKKRRKRAEDDADREDRKRRR